ncbi:MAG TPA: type II toxin-antitoxin system VapC family toxin [Agitococcus sp.]|nr:type II toxin-antitoxin system VapC family toxin [Agitococcus sp.]HMV61641.1 type II toxin-antitoxin system VapC family toxin [Agitococcus sp.]HMY28766.1 type II toxin-antitoxin system VapC family toxin [Agitococcus sp.]HMY82583.1 type II toxin-antitoxin system VapC family toxin [Agitococcus sp.]HNC04146.1 type II toxin-antitoxin system VapC family toxin [Agitococcus sp.]
MVTAIKWLLDTNIISEAIKPIPDSNVINNLTLYSYQIAIAAPVWHELNYGLLRLPDGKRKDMVKKYLENVVSTLTILPYDDVAAKCHAELRSIAQAKGQIIPFVDGQIAAIAISHNLTLVTRNLQDYRMIEDLKISNWFST